MAGWMLLFDFCMIFLFDFDDHVYSYMYMIVYVYIYIFLDNSSLLSWVSERSMISSPEKPNFRWSSGWLERIPLRIVSLMLGVR